MGSTGGKKSKIAPNFLDGAKIFCWAGPTGPLSPSWRVTPLPPHCARRPPSPLWSRAHYALAHHTTLHYTTAHRAPRSSPRKQAHSLVLHLRFLAAAERLDEVQAAMGPWDDIAVVDHSTATRHIAPWRVRYGSAGPRLANATEPVSAVIRPWQQNVRLAEVCLHHPFRPQ
jgi:hypothetical protein